MKTEVSRISQSARMMGDRLYLRPLNAKDIDDRYLKWFEDDSLMLFYSGSRQKFTQERILEEISSGAEAGTRYVLGIFLKENDLCIGNIKVGPIIKEQKISDLIVLIGDRSYHGKGLAVDAITLGNRVAFEWLDIRKLYGGMYENNIASIKAYTRAGWVIEGRLKGHYWVNEAPMDRILVGCFNPKYFSTSEVERIRDQVPQVIA